ncbi:MAG TPA: putative sulfate exporter family transporter [Paludibacter sp.]
MKTTKENGSKTHLILKSIVVKICFIIIGFICLTPFISPPIALFLGLFFALTIGAPFPKFNKNVSGYLLQVSVVGLGFGMNLLDSVKTGSDGMFFTLFSVVSVMLIGIMFGKWLGITKVPSYLIASGTAICGGSAIAAVGPIAKANESEMSVSLATIFVLNAVALFLFPVLGHWMHLTQQQFGLWAAIAIHDTSSVVGAGATFGEEALKVATTVKLTRALWIIPVSVFTSFYFKSKGDKVVIPWFILFFILAMVVNTYLNIPKTITQGIVSVSRQSLTLILFFIGARLSRSIIKSVGVKPLILGVTLWFFIAIISLSFIYFLY